MLVRQTPCVLVSLNTPSLHVVVTSCSGDFFSSRKWFNADEYRDFIFNKNWSDVAKELRAESEVTLHGGKLPSTYVLELANQSGSYPDLNLTLCLLEDLIVAFHRKAI